MAKRPIKVVEVPILQQDIDNGRSKSMWTCPIALACTRLDARHMWTVGVKVAARVGLDADDVDYYSLGVDADEFVHKFDSGEDVFPQTVHLYHSPGAVIHFYGDGETQQG